MYILAEYLIIIMFHPLKGDDGARIHHFLRVRVEITNDFWIGFQVVKRR